MSRKKLKRFELSADYFVTVGRGPDSGDDRIFTFSGAGIAPSQGISLLAHEIEILIPILQQTRADMIREASLREDAATSEWSATSDPELTPPTD